MTRSLLKLSFSNCDREPLYLDVPEKEMTLKEIFAKYEAKVLSALGDGIPPGKKWYPEGFFMLKYKGDLKDFSLGFKDLPSIIETFNGFPATVFHLECATNPRYQKMSHVQNMKLDRIERPETKFTGLCDNRFEKAAMEATRIRMKADMERDREELSALMEAKRREREALINADRELLPIEKMFVAATDKEIPVQTKTVQKKAIQHLNIACSENRCPDCYSEVKTGWMACPSCGRKLIF